MWCIWEGGDALNHFTLGQKLLQAEGPGGPESEALVAYSIQYSVQYKYAQMIQTLLHNLVLRTGVWRDVNEKPTNAFQMFLLSPQQTAQHGRLVAHTLYYNVPSTYVLMDGVT